MSAVTHPKTVYSNLSNSELRSMYDESVWFKLNESQKLDLLQETVNREAIANGSQYSCTVVFADLKPGVSGEQNGNTIFLDRNTFVNNLQTVVYDNNHTATFITKNANIKAYECLMHEHQHVLQEAIADGVVKADAETTALCKANGFTTSIVDGKLGCQYMSGETGYDLYFLNPTEADAYRVSESKTMALVNELNEKAGVVKTSNALYCEEMKDGSYDARLEQIKEKYNNENIEKDVANVLKNSYYETNIPVDKNIEKKVHEEMIATHNSIYKKASLEESKMDNNKWVDMHVSRETYDNTLRDSVNAYYEHAMNDPSVSNEEAVAQTGQVAESYLNAIDAFDAAQAEAGAGNEAQSAAETGTGLGTSDAGAGVSGGIDGGVDGGVDGGAGVE